MSPPSIVTIANRLQSKARDTRAPFSGGFETCEMISLRSSTKDVSTACVITGDHRNARCNFNNAPEELNTAANSLRRGSLGSPLPPAPSSEFPRHHLPRLREPVLPLPLPQLPPSVLVSTSALFGAMRTILSPKFRAAKPLSANPLEKSCGRESTATTDPFLQRAFVEMRRAGVHLHSFFCSYAPPTRRRADPACAATKHPNCAPAVEPSCFCMY
mmetsp:Transcript_2631/g.7173  ORF Transcript_2631/g.7173 Transcript_2631/m.7173 type:complete len:215 (+) Transcript_2631:448-1092(+)